MRRDRSSVCSYNNYMNIKAAYENMLVFVKLSKY